MSVLWCQGMFASGSTWLYNVALAVAAALDPPCPVQGRFVFRPADALGLSAPGIRHVVKAHQARDGVERIASAAAARQGGGPPRPRRPPPTPSWSRCATRATRWSR